jgi:hypothetical protein
MATTSSRPKLPQLKTPMTATFPSELSALSAKSPLLGYADFVKSEDGTKTPITPPIAYTVFLKKIEESIVSPPLTGKEHSQVSTPTSAPSTSSSDHSNCSCSCETHKSPASAVLPSPFTYPTSAPPSALMGRPRIPQSPAVPGRDSPLSATSTLRSPFSVRSPYEWDVASKRRSFDIMSPKISRCGVRHVREVVTRTVTYTPRMKAAPKGKRRKVDLAAPADVEETTTKTTTIYN